MNKVTRLDIVIPSCAMGSWPCSPSNSSWERKDCVHTLSTCSLTTTLLALEGVYIGVHRRPLQKSSHIVLIFKQVLFARRNNPGR